MATTIRLTRHLDSETVNLPELRSLVGRDVEIVVREIEPATEGLRSPLRGSVLRYAQPFEPVADGDWEAMG